MLSALHMAQGSMMFSYPMSPTLLFSMSTSVVVKPVLFFIDQGYGIIGLERILPHIKSIIYFLLSFAQNQWIFDFEPLNRNNLKDLHNKAHGSLP